MCYFEFSEGQFGVADCFVTLVFAHVGSFILALLLHERYARAILKLGVRGISTR